MEYIETINGANIRCWESFHDEFQKKLGFFDGYGRNMNAWIDCLSDIYTNGKYDSLIKFNLNEGDKLILIVVNIDVWQEVSRETFDAFINCTLEVNSERTNIYMALK